MSGCYASSLCQPSGEISLVTVHVNRLLCCVRIAIALCALLAASSQAALELADSERYRLDNGLTVLLLVDRNFPVASVQMLYRVGARNEITGKTGLAHFLEHMAFRATGNFPDTEVVSRIYAVGGEWHGYTWTDQTTYFATVPRAELDLLLEIEADRMAQLVIDPEFVEAERGAVIAELNMYENDPSTVLFDSLVYTSFLAHPYRNNTIGWESDLERITHSDLVDFYEAHYHPGNAVLAVVGDFDRPTVRRRIVELFGGIEGDVPTPLPHTAEPVQTGERRIDIAGNAPARQFMIGYRAPATSHPDFATFLVLQEVLAGGSGVSFLQNDWGTTARASSPLGRIGADITTWYPPSAQDYLFVIGGSLDGDATSADERAVETAVEAAVSALRAAPIDDIVLAQAVAAVADELVYDLQTTEDAAHQLAYFEGLGALGVLLTLPEQIRRVTAADVRQVAAAWLAADKRTLAWYREGAVDEPPAGAHRLKLSPPLPDDADTSPVTAPAMRRLGNGLTAIVLPSDLAPSLALAVVVPGFGLTQGGFEPGDPDTGALTWRARGRPGDLTELATQAAAALADARYTDASSTADSPDPSARLEQEFLRLMVPAANLAGDAARPAVVIAAGDLEPGRTFRALEDAFGSFLPAETASTALASSPSGTRRVSLGRPIAQAQLGYIVDAPAPDDPDYLAWRLLQYIFAHDYEGRLGKEAIGRQGLAYYIDARYRSAGGPGWSSFATGVSPSKLDVLARLLAAEIERLSTEPPTAAEIEEAKRHLVGRAISAAQSNEERITHYARHWLRHGSLPSADRLERELDQVSRDDVIALVERFSSGLTITVTP